MWSGRGNLSRVNRVLGGDSFAMEYVIRRGRRGGLRLSWSEEGGDVVGAVPRV